VNAFIISCGVADIVVAEYHDWSVLVVLEALSFEEFVPAGCEKCLCLTIKLQVCTLLLLHTELHDIFFSCGHIERAEDTCSSCENVCQLVS
jgi:hypothetical protein